MLVLNGLLARSSICASFDLDVPGLWYQVLNGANRPISTSYSGPGHDGGSFIVVADGEKWPVSAEPTEASKEEWDGFWARVDALAARWPKNKSDAYMHGWRYAHRQIEQMSTEGRARLRRHNQDRREAAKEAKAERAA